MVPGIGKRNAIRHARRLLRDRAQSLEELYAAANRARDLRRELHLAVAELASSERSKSAKSLLGLIDTWDRYGPEDPEGRAEGDIYDALREVRGLLELLDAK